MNSILMLGDCVGERLNLEVVLGIGGANRLKSPVLVVKYQFLWCVSHRKKRSLGELGHRGFIAFFVVVWLCYRFVAVAKVASGENYGLEFFKGTWLQM